MFLQKKLGIRLHATGPHCDNFSHPHSAFDPYSAPSGDRAYKSDFNTIGKAYPVDRQQTLISADL